jgi:hypothetical protein
LKGGGHGMPYINSVGAHLHHHSNLKSIIIIPGKYNRVIVPEIISRQRPIEEFQEK